MPISKHVNNSALVRQAGFTLVELLVVIAIVAILAVSGAVMIGNRQSVAVRSLMDELEGAISNAHQAAVATGRDTALVSWGSWDADTPLRVAYGDAELTNIKNIAEAILAGSPPADPNNLREQTVEVAFHYYINDKKIPTNSIQRRAKIVVSGDDGGYDAWTNAMTDNEDISTVVPFTTAMNTVLDEKNNFFKGDDTISQVTINGYTKRFNKTVFVKVVGTNSGGGVMAGSPMGLLVLLENSASVFKFYNPGSKSGDGKWRRI